MFFRLNKRAGEHEQNGRTYKPGDIIETEMDLCAKFAGKFTLLHDDEYEDSGITEPSIDTPSEEDGDSSKKKKSKPSSGVKRTKKKDVDATEDFPAADDIGVKVFKKSKSNGDWYNVIDPDNDNEILNQKLLRKDKVSEFIESITEEDE